MSSEDKKLLKKNKSAITPLENFLGLAERHTERASLPGVFISNMKVVCQSWLSDSAFIKILMFQEEAVDIHNPCSILPEEYFDINVDLKDRDIGRPREIATKIQKFKASLSLCEEYPLALQDQVHK